MNVYSMHKCNLIETFKKARILSKLQPPSYRLASGKIENCIIANIRNITEKSSLNPPSNPLGGIVKTKKWHVKY